MGTVAKFSHQLCYVTPATDVFLALDTICIFRKISSSDLFTCQVELHFVCWLGLIHGKTNSFYFVRNITLFKALCFYNYKACRQFCIYITFLFGDINCKSFRACSEPLQLHKTSHIRLLKVASHSTWRIPSVLDRAQLLLSPDSAGLPAAETIGLFSTTFRPLEPAQSGMLILARVSMASYTQWVWVWARLDRTSSSVLVGPTS